ncbi:hypothetical protein [Urbifossiella limnaea]|uniref:Uncharacterized protein n=1 Tax=Urbifossiella limnaea TaxID=2528023 RepID=A0A517XXA0_9BACT|nr:hypothetical protein [Urbifossiella limnaea]QDU22104.1 hypothetical protein ETAA1_40790 [Urbifossiella limnaea]
MTTERRLVANRANAVQSTGPRTDAGKAAVALNALGHGLFSGAALVPGESPDEWEEHRAGVVASLAPVGALELALAERVALTLWRMRRVTRHEAGALSAAVAGSAVPEPVEESPAAAFLHLKGYKRDPERLADARRLATTAEALAGAADELVSLLGRLADTPAAEPVPAGVARLVFRLGWEMAEGMGRDALPAAEPTFLKRIGADCRRVDDVTWTVGLVRAGLDYYANRIGCPAARVVATVTRHAATVRADAMRDAAARRAAEAALVARAEFGPRWRADAALLPGADVAERVMRVEAHLGRQLQLTLGQIERLQAIRAGQAVAPPTALNVTFTSDTELPKA